ncbi:MAG: cbb3-type cytochrome oxidase assembly protein CcoS [Vicinamibacteria bacterium]|nr:cbb3-type cytochrome oxidase assembly protein CcoS [Vicinamibacteria bacterium]
MSVIVLLICAGGLVAGGFLCAFLWAVESGQFDDTYTPALRVLLDDDGSVSPSGSEGAVHDQSRS